MTADKFRAALGVLDEGRPAWRLCVRALRDEFIPVRGLHSNRILRAAMI